MCEAFQQTVALHPQQVALSTPGGAVMMTGEQDADWVAQVAAVLRGLGVRWGDPVALMMTNRPELSLVDAAVSLLGALPSCVGSWPWSWQLSWQQPGTFSRWPASCSRPRTSGGRVDDR